MFFNICIFRMVNPNNAKGWDNIFFNKAYILKDVLSKIKHFLKGEVHLAVRPGRSTRRISYY